MKMERVHVHIWQNGVLQPTSQDFNPDPPAVPVKEEISYIQHQRCACGARRELQMPSGVVIDLLEIPHFLRRTASGEGKAP